jgi:outer membrane protein OmpA-like peptidoglycan-associated protein
MLKKIAFLIIPLFVFCNAFSQDVIGFESESSENYDNLELGLTLYKQGKYYEAIPYLETASKQRSNKKDISISYRLGQASKFSRLYSKAENAFELVNKRSKDSEFSDAWLYLAEMQMTLGKYEEAKANFVKFLSVADSFPELKPRAENGLKVINNLSDFSGDPDKYKVSILPQTVNGNASNYGACFAHNRLWYTASVEILDFQSAKVGSTDATYNSYYIDRLFNSEVENGSFNRGFALENLMYSRTSNYLPPVFSEDGKTIYTSICKQVGKKQCWIYWSDFELGGVVELDWVSEPVNNFSYSSKDPCMVTIDGKQVMFFSSERKKQTKGGFDLYYVIFDTNSGEAGELMPLSDKVNTSGDEISPFYDVKTKTLFFSSNGHKGLGQFDIYALEGDPFNGWGRLNNLGAPINSGYDDYYYYQRTFKDSIMGYFSNNRIKNETCCDKIYEFKKETRYYNLTIDVRGCFDYIVPEKFRIFAYTLGFDEPLLSATSDSSNIITTTLIQDRPSIVKVIHENYDTAQFEIRSEKDTTVKINLSSKIIELTGTIKGENYSKLLRNGKIVFLDSETREELQVVSANTKPYSILINNRKEYEVEVTGKYHMMKNFELKFTDSEMCAEKASRHYKLPTVDIGASILKNKIEFKTASFEVKESSYPELDRLAEFILDNPDIILEVQGHTDNIGSYSYNKTLSQRRAESITRYLVTKGVSQKQLQAKGYSFSKPIATNATAAGRSKNRRVGFKVIYIDEDKREFLD